MKAESQEFHNVMQVLLHSSRLSSYDRKNLLVQFIEDKPRSIKIVHERNSPKVKSTSFASTATANPLKIL